MRDVTVAEADPIEKHPYVDDPILNEIKDHREDISVLYVNRDSLASDLLTPLYNASCTTILKIIIY